MPGRSRNKWWPKNCFECAVAFATPEDVFSEDHNGNGYCRDCTVTKWQGAENFKDYALGASASIVKRFTQPAPRVVYRT